MSQRSDQSIVCKSAKRNVVSAGAASAATRAPRCARHAAVRDSSERAEEQDAAIEAWARFLACAHLSDLTSPGLLAALGPLTPAMRSLCRALAALYRGEARAGLNAMSLAMREAVGFERYLVADALLTAHLGRGDFASAKQILERFTEPPVCLQSVFLAAQSVIEAEGRNYRVSARLFGRALTACSRLDAPGIRLRVLCRLMATAFKTRRLEVADELAREVVLNAELMGAHRIAAIAYSHLFAFANYHQRNGERAKSYAAALLHHAEEAGDAGFQRYALVGSAWTAFVYGNMPNFLIFHARLSERPMPEQLLERATAVFLDAVQIAYMGNFQTAFQITNDAAESTVFTEVPRLLHRAAAAVCLFALGQDKAAHGYAKDVLAGTGRGCGGLSIVDRYIADMARLVAISVLYVLGDTVRSRRAVSKKLDPTFRFVESLYPNGIRLEVVPQWFRGMAEFINRAVAVAQATALPSALTNAERELLSLLLQGKTRTAAAAELGKSKYTVAHQLESIYRKLDVHSRHELIARAADLSAQLGGPGPPTSGALGDRG